MRIGSLELTLHRTVRVAEGNKTSNLPPSLGHIETFKVSDYKNCPVSWDRDAVFVALRDTEALWMSFSTRDPLALLVGAGGMNALNGEKLGTKLKEDNYLVTPPQPWLDGWKSDEDHVYQFTATPYEKGNGLSVAEQLMGEKSKTGAIGIAVFELRDKYKHVRINESVNYIYYPDSGAYTMDYGYPSYSSNSFNASGLVKCSAMSVNSLSGKNYSGKGSSNGPLRSVAEMGIGRGGKIHQKVYPDPYGLKQWKSAPETLQAIYIVNAESFEYITGRRFPKPVDHSSYQGMWYDVNDNNSKDIAGTPIFDKLKTTTKSDVFPAK